MWFFRCIPYCPGGCPNGVCTAPHFCICNAGYRKDTSVKGRSACVKRIRRSLAEKKPEDIDSLLAFKIPEYWLCHMCIGFCLNKTNATFWIHLTGPFPYWTLHLHAHVNGGCTYCTLISKSLGCSCQITFAIRNKSSLTIFCVYANTLH